MFLYKNMQRKHSRGIGILGVIIGAASMVIVYASGIVHPGMQLPQTATVTLQDRWSNWKWGNSVTAKGGTFDYNEFEKIYSLLKNEYYHQEKIATGAMMDGALKWMVAALGDPYTAFFDVQQNSSFTQELKGEQDFEGIGAAILKKDDAIEIQEVYKGTPSFEAGLRPLDLVVEINGEKTTEMTTEQAVSKIRGPQWTTVELTILRISEKEADKRLFNVTITRKKVIIPSVSSRVIELGARKIWYINISIIGQDTEIAMKREVKALLDQKIDGVILDLRGNGGGFLDIGVEVASHFIKKWATVTTTEYRDSGYNEIYVSKWYAEFENLPTVVLVDSLTASAWEIIAAALKEDQGALILGTKTFGKGSIQTIAEFGSGQAIKYTIGKWYTPNHENVSGTGLIPDIDVPFDSEAYKKDQTDNQLNRAKEEMIKLIR